VEKNSPATSCPDFDDRDALFLVLIIAEGEKNQSRKKKGNYNEFLEKKTSPFYP